MKPESARTNLARHKLHMCGRFARMCVQDYQETGNKAFLQLKTEALEDARYWFRELRGLRT